MKNERKKIAYLAILQWKAIKQRSQFIAEQLSQDYDVDYIEFKGIRTLLGLNRDFFSFNPTYSSGVKIKRIFQINEYKTQGLFLKYIVHKINDLFRFSKRYKDYDCFWITHPFMYALFKDKIPASAKIVYDCMDDWPEFDRKVMSDNLLIKIEKELILKSDVVFCTAEYLKMKILSRYNINKDILIVNNAIGMPKQMKIDIIPVKIQHIFDEISSFEFSLVYIGTISTWFDFDLMIKILDKYPHFTLVLIGPCEIIIPKHDRIKSYGGIDRKYVFEIMSMASALVMPFIVNELIRSVNPVKLNEYIYSGRPVIVPNYEETIPFSDFVFRYDNENDFCKIVDDILDGRIKQKDVESCKEFVKHNRWEDRYSQINKLLAQLW